MQLLRWIAFLPSAAVVITVAHIATGLAAKNLAWWIAAPLVLFFGGAIAVFVGRTCKIAPDPRIGGGVVLALFLCLEAGSLFMSFSGSTVLEIIIRLYTDTVIAVGCIVAIKADRKG